MYYMKTFSSSRSRGKKMFRVSSGETFVHWNLRKLLLSRQLSAASPSSLSLCLPSSQQPGARDRRPILEKLHSLWGSWKKLKSHPPDLRHSSLSLAPHILYRRHCRCSNDAVLRLSCSRLLPSLRKSPGLTLYNFAREPRINQRNAINRILIAILRGLSISNSRRPVLLVSPAGTDFLPLARAMVDVCVIPSVVAKSIVVDEKFL